MRNKRGKILMVGGVLLIVGALSLTVYNIGEEQHAEQHSSSVVQVLEEQIVPEPAPLNAVFGTGASEAQTIQVDGENYIGVLEIPSLDLSLPVQQEWSYSRLKSAPCRYAGSFLDDSMVIAGHNYRRHFGGLRNLQVGDSISFTAADGTAYAYIVNEIQVLDGTAVDQMVSGEWDLTLFTCTYDGRSRVTVRCVREQPLQSEVAQS